MCWTSPQEYANSRTYGGPEIVANLRRLFLERFGRSPGPKLIPKKIVSGQGATGCWPLCLF